MVRLQRDVAKADLQQRRAEARAQFEEDLARKYLPEDHPAWAEAFRVAQAAAERVNAEVTAHCEALGIRPEFAPKASVGWFSRGENASKERRAELRKVAEARLEAMHKAALATITSNSNRAELEILSRGLKSDEARVLLESLPAAADLLPPVLLTDVEALLPQRARGAA